MVDPFFISTHFKQEHNSKVAWLARAVERHVYRSILARLAVDDWSNSTGDKIQWLRLLMLRELVVVLLGVGRIKDLINAT